MDELVDSNIVETLTPLAHILLVEADRQLLDEKIPEIISTFSIFFFIHRAIISLDALLYSDTVVIERHSGSIE